MVWGGRGGWGKGEKNEERRIEGESEEEEGGWRGGKRGRKKGKDWEKGVEGWGKFLIIKHDQYHHRHKP